MRLLFVFAVLAVFSVSESEDYLSTIQRASMEFPPSYKGKTLSELGLIEKLEVKYEMDKHSSDSEDLKAILFERRILARSELEDSLALGLPPRVKIIYKDGTRVSANRYEASITPPNGQPFFCILLEPELIEQDADDQAPARAESKAE